VWCAGGEWEPTFKKERTANTKKERKRRRIETRGTWTGRKLCDFEIKNSKKWVPIDVKRECKKNGGEKKNRGGRDGARRPGRIKVHIGETIIKTVRKKKKERRIVTFVRQKNSIKLP